MGLMRLMLLLLLLGGAFYTIMEMAPKDGSVARQGLSGQPKDDAGAGARALAASSAQPDALPASVRRLADAPVTGPLRPVVVERAVIDPDAVLPMEQRVRQARVTEGRAEGLDIRKVNVSRANVRGGPSTGFDIVGRLAQGEEVEVIEVNASGWARVRIQGDGVEGWVSARLLRQ